MPAKTVSACGHCPCVRQYVGLGRVVGSTTIKIVQLLRLYKIKNSDGTPIYSTPLFNDITISCRLRFSWQVCRPRLWRVQQSSQPGPLFPPGAGRLIAQSSYRWTSWSESTCWGWPTSSSARRTLLPRRRGTPGSLSDVSTRKLGPDEVSGPQATRRFSAPSTGDRYTPGSTSWTASSTQ